MISILAYQIVLDFLLFSIVLTNPTILDTLRLLFFSSIHWFIGMALFTHNKAVPGALVVQTHRDPVTRVASACSLISTFNMAVTNEIDLNRMASLMLECC